MDAERWEHIARIYGLAAERPPEERLRFVADACGSDDELAREVESLLRQDISHDDRMERITADVAERWSAPTSIGPYRIISLVGEGGMGVVYEAEQAHPRRTVALKVVKSVLAGPALLRRFAQEADVLGRLEHPNIARIYDAGTADSPWGPQPYFAMELVRGRSLLEHAKAQRLNTARRLELTVKVCDAVEHAHRRGIIHRDLKPGNIIVDDSGEPKVLDFGVARMAAGEPNRTRQTRLGDLVGTLAYMSPEQVLADPEQLDARSDVYSLGVALYELLTGRLPYVIRAELTEAVRTVREEEPARLSSIDRTYRGDLETIVAKALEKDRDRRYASAGALAADLRRYLTNRPIAARRPTAAYQTRKFVRRHRTVVIAASAVFVVLVAGVAVSTSEAILAIRERDRARRAEEIATTVNDFLQKDLLAQAGARAQAGTNTPPDPNLTVRAALDRAAARIAGRFDDQPAVEASIRRTIGNAYFELNRMAEAEIQLKRAADLDDRTLGPHHPETLAVLDTLGVVYNYEGKYAAARSTLSNVFDARRRSLGPEHKDTLAAMSHLGLAIAYGGDDATAMSLFEPLLTVQRRVYGDENPDTLDIMDNLGGTYRQLGKYSEARAIFERELEISRRVRGADHPDTLNCIGNLATVYRALGDFARAEALSVARLDGTRRAFGERHWETQNCELQLAICYRGEERYADAESLLKAAVTQLQRTLSDHPLTLQAEYQLAEVYRQERRFAEAETLFATVVQERRRLLGAENWYTAQALGSLGESLFDEHRFADAEPPLRLAVQAWQKAKPDAWEGFYAESLLGDTLAAEGRTADGRPLLDSGFRGLVSRASTIPAEYRSVPERVRGWLAAVAR